MTTSPEISKKLITFENKKIRRIWHKEEWWFSIIDIIEVLTESPRPRKYWADLKSKLQEEGFEQLSAKIGQLKLIASDGKKRDTNCANTQTMPNINHILIMIILSFDNYAIKKKGRYCKLLAIMQIGNYRHMIRRLSGISIIF